MTNIHPGLPQDPNFWHLQQEEWELDMQDILQAERAGPSIFSRIPRRIHDSQNTEVFVT